PVSPHKPKQQLGRPYVAKQSSARSTSVWWTITALPRLPCVPVPVSATRIEQPTLSRSELSLNNSFSKRDSRCASEAHAHCFDPAIATAPRARTLANVAPESALAAIWDRISANVEGCA